MRTSARRPARAEPQGLTLAPQLGELLRLANATIRELLQVCADQAAELRHRRQRCRCGVTFRDHGERQGRDEG